MLASFYLLMAVESGVFNECHISTTQPKDPSVRRRARLRHGAFVGQHNAVPEDRSKKSMVSHDSVIYEKDLELNTLEIVRRIELFNPDKTWTTVLEK